MNPRTRSRRWRLLAPALSALVVVAGVPTADAHPRTQPVTAWTSEHALPLSTVDPAAPLGDLRPLRRSVGDAEIVGLGESTHGAAQEIDLKLRTLRLLVERMGFRSIAWEEDWTLGRRIDTYIRTGSGSLHRLVSRMSGQWQYGEVAEALRWLREYNAGHADKVRFAGVEFYLTPPLAYDDVKHYVARTAPQRLRELRRHLRVIRPSTSNMYAYIPWFEKQPDQQRYVRHAHRVHELVAGLPHRPQDRRHAKTLHTARQILSFYEHYTLPDSDSFAYRDAHAARNLRWWRTFTGDKIAYWAASPHTANAPRLRIVMPPDGVMRFASAGSYLRRWYGQRYLSVGFTFDHGRVSTGAGDTAPMPAPAPGWFERPLGRVGLDQFALDLRAPAPPPVRRWLHDPVRTRGLPGVPDSFIAGGTLARWFDVIVHRQRVTPTRPVFG